ncbi:MAG: signal peptide peptidase SppA [Flavobacteriaceae bacterium]
MRFLRNLLAAILGCLIAFGILFIMFMVFVSILGSTDDAISIKEDSVLELQFQLPLADYVGNDEVDPFGLMMQQSQGLDEILHAIEVAKNDGNIRGISLSENFLMAGWAQTQSIRKTLEDFKQSGKFVYAYGDYYLQKDYYLASVADSIFLNPVGAMDFKGLSSEVLFYKEFQEKTGIKMEVVRHGKYKSAVEPFLEDKMSEANRDQIKELLSSVWKSVVNGISESRHMDVTQLNAIADTLGGRTPEYAVRTGLIDGTLFHDEYEEKLRHALGLDADGRINYVSLNDYTKKSNLKKLRTGKDKVAVIYAQGDILYGEGNQEYIGQEMMLRAIRRVRDDDRIKAVVLRVNSPGGNALTSDIIWRGLELLKQEKPLVVSMGNVAASGGYYIAVGAHKIFAEPTTITGSIGVFGTIPNVHGLAEDIGINAEQVGTHKNSIDYSFFEPMSDGFRKVVKEGIEEVYGTFLDRVAQGRGMTVAEVDSIAQGRVWSGVEAHRLGLVDELGTLEDAIEAAADMADMESYGIKRLPRYKTGLERLLEDLEGSGAGMRASWIQREFGEEAYQVMQQLKPNRGKKGIQARLPFDLNIK